MKSGTAHGSILLQFVAALAILAAGVWLGNRIGTAAAVYRSTSPRLAGAAAAHVQAVLAQIERVQSLRIQAAATASLSRADLPAGILELQGLEPGEADAEIRRYTDFNLGIVYVAASLAAERDHDAAAAVAYMKSAQPLFQALGWRDTSPAALKAAAVREMGAVSAGPNEDDRQ